MRRWLAAWAVTLVAVGPVAAERPGFDLAATARHLDALTVSITGNVEELRASELLNYHRVEDGVAACMRAHGRPYRKSPFVDFYRDFTDADLGYGSGRASIVDSLTYGTRRFELNESAGVRLRQAGVDDNGVRPEDVGVLHGCKAPFDYRSYIGADPPAGAYELADFDDLLEPAYRDAGVIAAWRTYDSCMRNRYGYVVGDDRSDFLFKPRATGPSGSEMRAAFAADADCRRPAYVAAMRVISRRFGAWEAEHRPQLDAVHREWRHRVAAAAHLPR